MIILLAAVFHGVFTVCDHCIHEFLCVCCQWLPYRQMYPLASVSEWKHKGSDREKKIRAIQLINPDMDVREIWIKDDDIEDDDYTPTGVYMHFSIIISRQGSSEPDII